uniref:G-protein coupled receptors family 1 profile domain-containing protein n=1 Tax=Panagrellus redivivus TaxID=6233 RepID=A0A7E4VD74_PANRE
MQFGPDLDTRTVRFYNGIAAFFCAAILNTMHLYIVITKSPKWLHPYKKIFFFEIFNNMAHVTFVMLPNVMYFSKVVDGHFYFFHVLSGIIFQPPQPWTTIFVIPYVFFLNWNVTIVPVHFIYRYLVVCQNYEMGLWVFFGAVLISAIAPAIYVVLIACGELQDNHMTESMSYLFKNSDWVDSNGNTPNFAIMQSDGITLHTVIVPVSILLSYIIVFVCTIQIHTRVQHLNHIQKDRQKAKNVQLNVVLICNAVVPFVVSAIPSGSVQVAKLFGFSLPATISHIMLLTPWSAVTNPIMAMTIVTPYRRFWMPWKKRIIPTMTGGRTTLTTY